MNKKELIGLNQTQVDEKISQGLTNDFTSDTSTSNWQIVKRNVFTLFNALNFVIAVALVSVQAWSNLVFFAVISFNAVTGIITELRAKRMIDKLNLVSRELMENAKEEMEFFNKFIDKELFERLDTLVNSNFERITYTEAIEILKNTKQKFEYKVEWGIDLQTEHERYLAEKHFKKPVFVTDYPKDIKAFYMKLNEDGKTL